MEETSRRSISGRHQSYQTRSNAIILQEKLPAYCIPKVVRKETGEVLYEKVYMRHPAPSKDHLETRLEERIGFRRCSTTRWTSCSTIQTQIMIELRDLLFAVTQGARKTSRSQEIETRSFHEEAVKHDRTGQPVVNRDESGHEQTMLNEVNMDFRVLGLPHSVVKQAESYRVRELVKKIENHPDRHSLQLDPQQDKAYNPFSATAKRMIKDVGNVELFDLFETDRKTQCKECLSYCCQGIVYCTCGHLLKETVANRSFIEYTLDLISIREYVIKKGRLHGHRCGKAPENKEYYLPIT